MSFLYVYEDGAKISFKQNRIFITVKEKSLERSLPVEGVENVVVIGEVSLTSPCVKELLRRGIKLTFLSGSGEFFGKLESTSHININRHLQQFKCYEDRDFTFKMAQEFIAAKIRNQITIIRRYERNRESAEVQKGIDELQIYYKKAKEAAEKDVLTGYEGYSARVYYGLLSKLTEKEFKFSGRSRRPPLDPFNSLLSFAYTLLIYDIFNAVEGKGLHPYISCLHAARQGHPALCSDLMEEWRAVIADALVMYVVSKGIVKMKDFNILEENKGVFLKPEIAKVFISEYEKKMRTQAKYLPYLDFATSFRRAIEYQAGQYVKAIEQQDPTLYKSVIIR